VLSKGGFIRPHNVEMIRESVVFIVLQLSQLLLNVCGGLQRPKIDVGVSGVVPNITLYGGVVVSDKKSIIASLYSPIEGHTHEEHNLTHVEEVLKIRHENVKNLTSVTPFELLHWPMINTKPCPNYQHTGHNRLERGQGMSHMQMWLEFVFFDVDVLDARVRKVPEFITSNDYSSVSGIFQSVENGSLYKNNIPFLEEDIMLVLEDAAVLLPEYHAVAGGAHDHPETKDLVKTYLSKALTRANVDVLSLGVTKLASRSRQLTEPDLYVVNTHNKEHSTHNAHTTTHITHTTHSTPLRANTHNAHAALHTTSDTITPYAYAITRAGARKLIACYDHCGLYIHEQLLACVQGEMLTHAHAVYPLFTQSE